MRVTCVTLLLLAVGGCDRTDGDAIPRERSVAVERTDDAATPSPAPAPAPAPSDVRPRERSSNPHHLVARAPESEIEPAARFRAFGTRDGQVFITLGPRVMRVREDGSLDDDPAWLAGLQSAPREDVTGAEWYVHTMGGRWPDDLLMTVVFLPVPSEPLSPQQVYRWSAGGWLRIANERRHFVAWPNRLVPWVDGSVLALRGFAHPGDTSTPPGGRVKQSASGKPLSVVRGPGKAPTVEMSVAFMDGLETGDLVAVASADAAEVLHVDASEGTRQMRALPAVDERRIEGVQLVDTKRGYVFGAAGSEPLLNRFDGETWTVDDPPPCAASIFALAVGAELWAICETEERVSDVRSGDLWRRESGVWARVELDEAVTAVVPTAAGPWITTTGSVYGPRPAESVIACPDNHANAATMLEYGAPAPALRCEHVAAFYVVLDAKPGDARPGLDAALRTARAAIGSEGPSLSLAEIEHRGETRVVLHAETYEMTPKNRKAIASAFGDAMVDTFCVDRLHEP